jgi:hypothetical protein
MFPIQALPRQEGTSLILRKPADLAKPIDGFVHKSGPSRTRHSRPGLARRRKREQLPQHGKWALVF